MTPIILSAANSGTFPSWTNNSYIAVQCGPGPGILTLQISGSYTGQFAVGSSLDGISMGTYPNGSIAQSFVLNGVGIPANGTGKFTVPVDAGVAYVYLSALTGGTPSIAASWGAGSGDTPGASGGGETVTIAGSLPAGTNNIGSVDTVGNPATPVWSNPSVASGSSVTLLAAGARTYLGVQNNTLGTITLGTGGQALSDIAGTNGITLAPGSLYEAPSNAIPQGPITVYQTSGSPTTKISVGVC